MDLESIFQGPPTPYKWNLLGQYLKGEKIHPGKGIEIDDSSGSGYLISAKNKRELRQSQPPPFSILSLRKVPSSDPVEYALTLQEGWVIERDTVVGNDAVLFHEVSVGADPMSDRPRPEVMVEDGDFVSVHFDTDTEGHVTGTPIIDVGTEKDSDHHQPPSGEGTGAVGSYYVKLLEFNITDGAPVITVYQQSDVEHSRLWTGQNIGGARYIHKEWDGATDTYDFRTLKQFVPTGGAVPDYGKIIVDPVGAEFDDANDAIKFSCIAEKDESPQIEVDDDGAGTITIKGNNKSGSLVWEYCEEESGETQETLLTWEDGLITNTNPNASFKAGCSDGLPSGLSGEILVHDGTDWVTLAKPDVADINNGTYEYYQLEHDGVAVSWGGVV